MLFMVIETFKDGDAEPIGERFQRAGRMLPEGILYHNSWVDPVGARCFQLMESPNRESLIPWIKGWDDLMDFEIVPVLTSDDFWSKHSKEQSSSQN